MCGSVPRPARIHIYCENSIELHISFIDQINRRQSEIGYSDRLINIVCDADKWTIATKASDQRAILLIVG